MNTTQENTLSVVSSDDESLVLVNDADEEIGFATKGRCHDGEGLLQLREELSLETPVRFLFKFRYHARYDTSGAERELCHVYAGLFRSQPAVNANEIAATAIITAAGLDTDIATRPDRYTPWLKLEWARLRREAWSTVQQFLAEHRR